MLDIRVVEKNPTGENSIAAMVARMTQAVKTSDNMSDTLMKLVPDIQDILRFEFSDANPAGWDPLQPMYVRWKRERGYPTTIGIMTGALKRAATDDAIIDAQPQKLIYKINTSVENPDAIVPVGDYAAKFAERRPIFIYVSERIRALVKKAVHDAVEAGYGRGWK